MNARAESLRPWLDERRVLRIGLLVAGGFVMAAMSAFALPSVRAGHWAGTHLALAGAALAAVGTFMPHFGATLAGSEPEPAQIRLAGVLTLALGAASVVGGVSTGTHQWAVAGSVLIWVGLVITAWTTFRPAARPLARRHPIAQAAYAAALLQVAAGIALPALMLAGWEPAVAGWRQLKPAHVWLNLFGFLSLTIAATLVYLYPTVLGARIRARGSLLPMIGGMAAGPPLVAVAAIAGSQWLGLLGAVLSVVGGLGQALYAVQVWLGRGRWTTDPGWHRVTSGHLAAAIAWYVVSVTAVGAGVVRDGVAPAGWTLGAAAIPLVGGWALQALVGAWSHLLPAVASTEPARRARQRATLGRAAWPRLLAWNGGVLLAWLGVAGGTLPVTVVGALTLWAAAALAVALLVISLWALGASPAGGTPAASLPITADPLTSARPDGPANQGGSALPRGVPTARASSR